MTKLEAEIKEYAADAYTQTRDDPAAYGIDTFDDAADYMEFEMRGDAIDEVERLARRFKVDEMVVHALMEAALRDVFDQSDWPSEEAA